MSKYLASALPLPFQVSQNVLKTSSNGQGRQAPSFDFLAAELVTFKLWGQCIKDVLQAVGVCIYIHTSTITERLTFLGPRNSAKRLSSFRQNASLSRLCVARTSRKLGCSRCDLPPTLANQIHFIVKVLSHCFTWMFFLTLAKMA